MIPMVWVLMFFRRARILAIAMPRLAPSASNSKRRPPSICTYKKNV